MAIVLAHPWVASANHHQWIISELFSNWDGTVQFVELRGTANNEQFINGFTVNTTPAGTTGLIATSAALGPDLPNGNTAGAYLLIGTNGYATLAALQGAPAPDRLLPDNFLEIAADTVRYAGIAATDRVYTNLPTAGIDSIDYENPSGTVNTPRNFAGATGSIDASPATPTPLCRIESVAAAFRSPGDVRGAGTGEKPQSKVWRHQNAWWAVFPNTTNQLQIFKFNESQGKWDPSGSPATFAGVTIDASTKADVLVDGNVPEVAERLR